MIFLLKLKAWQLFLIIVICLSIPYIFPWIIGYAIYVAWIYTIGENANKLLPKHSKPSIIFFKISCVVMLLIAFPALLFGQEIVDNQYLFWPFFAIVLPINLYAFSFAARMLESAVEGALVNFGDSLKTFFGFWIFPIGIWFIQPLAQRVLLENENGVTN